MEQKPATNYQKIFLFSLFFLLCLVLLVEGFYYLQLKKRLSQSKTLPPTVPSLSTPNPLPQETLSPKAELVATGRINVYEFPGGKELGFLFANQKFILTGKPAGGWLQILDPTEGHIVWIKEGSLYKLAREAPEKL